MFGCGFLKRLGLALIGALVLGIATPAQAAPGDHPKLDSVLNKRANTGSGDSRVIVTFKAGWDASSDLKKLGARLGRRLDLINAQVVELSNSQLKGVANHPGVASLHWDRPTQGTMDLVAVTTGARTVQQVLNFNGNGVGVAVIDSGITPWHNDLTPRNKAASVMSSNGQRVVAFVDYVNGYSVPYDDNGHGTHVSGIIAGNGYDSEGVRAAMAPLAHIVSLKVLDASAKGVISNVIAAFDFAVQNRSLYNIRVVNVSVAAGVYESYNTDPLTLAAKRAVNAGIVVVAAAGNLGRDAAGLPQYGGVTAPGNAPWVLTVGASNHQGTALRYDDTVASFSSRGPTWIDFQAKPDLVAPGVGLVSLSDPTSLLYTTHATSLVSGSLATINLPYLRLSGTSMAAPVVAGTVALMLQANPNLTPNLVKAILQYTAQTNPGDDALTQGAGFLNAKGAVDLASYFRTAQAGQPYPSNAEWSRRIHWGNHRISGGVISPSANAWALTTVWGVSREADGDNIVWGTDCETDTCDNIVWGTSDNLVWGTMDSDSIDVDGDNIVWGTYCQDELCDNIVWGTWETDGDNIVWGTDCDGEDCDNIVWGTQCENPDCGDNIVWGTECEDCDNIVWGTDCETDTCDNIVWGTECYGEICDNIVWGTLVLDATIETTTSVSTSGSWGSIIWTESAFQSLFVRPSLIAPPSTSETTTSTDTTNTTAPTDSTTTTTIDSTTTDSTTSGTVVTDSATSTTIDTTTSTTDTTTSTTDTTTGTTDATASTTDVTTGTTAVTTSTTEVTTSTTDVTTSTTETTAGTTETTTGTTDATISTTDVTTSTTEVTAGTTDATTTSITTSTTDSTTTTSTTLLGGGGL